MKKSNLLHMDDYQKRNQTGKGKPDGAKGSNQASQRNERSDKRDDRPNVGDEKRPA